MQKYNIQIDKGKFKLCDIIFNSILVIMIVNLIYFYINYNFKLVEFVLFNSNYHIEYRFYYYTDGNVKANDDKIKVARKSCWLV